MTIFESTDRGATKVFDNDGLILTFNRQNLNLVKNSSGVLSRTDKSDSWICILEDEDLIARAKKHKSFTDDPSEEFYKSDKFRIIDAVPTNNSGASIVKAFNVEEKSKLKRLGFLEAKLLKIDGTYRADALEEEVAEYESLKKEIG